MAQACGFPRLDRVCADRRRHFLLCFIVIDKITPHDLWAEIVEKQNRALALVVAAMCLGISIIVAAAIHG